MGFSFGYTSGEGALRLQALKDQKNLKISKYNINTQSTCIGMDVYSTAPANPKPPRPKVEYVTVDSLKQM